MTFNLTLALLDVAFLSGKSWRYDSEIELD